MPLRTPVWRDSVLTLVTVVVMVDMVEEEKSDGRT